MIFKRTCNSLNIPVFRQKFSSPQKAKLALDNRLQAGQPAACQVGVYYLTYFPKEYRFHFNAHNLIVVGKEGDNYIISDPIMETLVTMNSYELERVRFARGPLAPRGQLYFPKEIQPVSDALMKQAIVTGIKRNIRDMLHIPGNIAGIRVYDILQKNKRLERQTRSRKIEKLPGATGENAGRNWDRRRWISFYLCRLFTTGTSLSPY